MRPCWSAKNQFQRFLSSSPPRLPWLGGAPSAIQTQLDCALKAHLKEHDEMVLAGMVYRMFTTTKMVHPLE